jgi:imidazolonepropionase-like amidohydrolase
VFFVQRASDIRQVVRYAQKNGMKPVIAGGAEAWLVANELAAAKVPVVLDALQDLPSDFDRLGSRLDNAKLLHDAGVPIAFSWDESFSVRKNRQLAGNAVAHGLPWEAALDAITSAPAEIFGIGAAHGRIEKGQSADLVLWSGDPLEVTSVAEQVWIAGSPVAMKSRQTELRDRYLERLKSGATR